MQFDKDIILENEYVLLRPLQAEDIELLAHFAQNEPSIWKYSLLQVQNENDLLKYIEQAVEARSQKKEYPFIVFDKKKQQYAGSTRFYDIQLQFQTLQLGYTWYGAEFQGTHINPNCKLLLLEYAFEKLNMERVEFRADNRNARSIKAMKNLGCIEEGILRNHLPTIDGGRRDSIILSILKSEWEADVKKNLIARIAKF
jgi:RimJ/RimL family protein N-acetyltransferase